MFTQILCFIGLHKFKPDIYYNQLHMKSGIVHGRRISRKKRSLTVYRKCCRCHAMVKYEVEIDG